MAHSWYCPAFRKLEEFIIEAGKHAMQPDQSAQAMGDLVVLEEIINKLDKAFQAQSKELLIATNYLEEIDPRHLSEYRMRAYPKIHPRIRSNP